MSEQMWRELARELYGALGAVVDFGDVAESWRAAADAITRYERAEEKERQAAPHTPQQQQVVEEREDFVPSGYPSRRELQARGL